MNDFWKSKKIANKTEREIAGVLSSVGFVILGYCNDNSCDIVCRNPNGKTIRIEVKEDFTCKRTNRIGLEFENRKKPSGISVSQADFYLYKIHCPDGVIRFYAISTKKLKSLVRNKAYVRIVYGGDDKAALNYLFDFSVVTKHFQFLWSN